MSNINAQFARFLITAAKACPEKYAADKVFISDLYEQIKEYSEETTPEKFQSTLWRLYKSQFTKDGQDLGFSLSRADLSYNCDQEKVRASRMERYGATFHLFTIK